MVATNAFDIKAEAIVFDIHVRPQSCDHNGKAQEQDKRKFEVEAIEHVTPFSV
jgi:hypothetical protein